MADPNYTILFQKLEEVLREPTSTQPGAQLVETDISEIEEIAELRPLVSEITKPEPNFFTTA